MACWSCSTRRPAPRRSSWASRRAGRRTHCGQDHQSQRHNAARAGAAVVLLTADDVGGTRSGFGKEGTDPGPQHPRARQNVVFEHGYFLAALGRKHVVMLYEPAVELPSDLSGLAYTPLDAGGAWKNLLARELKYMGYEVDLDVLLRD